MNSRARLIKAIDNSACLTRRQINDYIYKKLFPEEQYVVEMHLNECPFCNDAIEGFLKASNANQLLSEVDTLQLPAVEVAPEPMVEKVVPKKEAIIPPVSKTATDGPVHPSAAQRKTVTFDAPDRKRGMGWKVGLAAAAVVGLGIWGLNQFNQHKAEKAAMLAKANESAGALDEGVSPPVSRQEDSAMNAKYGMQSAPVVAARSSSVRQSNVATDSDAAMVAAADVPAAAAPASVAMSREATPSPALAAAKTAAPADAKAKTGTAPTLAKTSTPAETRAKSAEVVKEADMRTSSSATSAKPALTTAKTAVVTEKTVAKEKVRPSAKTPEERAKDAATKKAASEEKVIAQAEADYKKGMDLYKKKQYAAALPYFQAVAKKTDVPNSKQAAKYVKLCKEQLAKAKDDK